MSASELLCNVKHRKKSSNDIETGISSRFRDKSIAGPTYWLCGVRCRKGMSLLRAFERNLRTLSVMLKEKAQNGRPARPKVGMRRQGTDCFVIAKNQGNSRGAKGPGPSRRDRSGQRATGGTRWSRRKAAAFQRGHEPDESRDSRPESVSGSE